MHQSYTVFPKVSEIAHMGVITIDGGASVSDALKMMLANDIRDVIFELDQGHGIFTFKDLLDFHRQQIDFSTALNQLPLQLLPYVDAEDNILDIFTSLMEESHQYFGVLGGKGKLIGIISHTDIIASVDPNLLIERKSIGDILFKRPLVTVSPDTLMESVLFHLKDEEDALLVVEEGLPVGILTTRDAIQMIEQGKSHHSAVSAYMSTPVETVTSDTSIRDVINHLRDRKFKRAVVVDDAGHLLGLVTQKDLAGFAYSHWVEMMRAHANELNEMVGMLEEKARRMEYAALSDPLTGVGNRRHLNQVLEGEIGRFYRYKTTAFSLMLIDIDYFKKINDEQGHLKGDEALIGMCRRIQPTLRDSDLLARWGGDEFAVLMPVTDIKAAAGVAERVMQLMAAAGEGEIALTGSIGIAEYRQGESLEELVRRADAAVYHAKQDGRNCFRVAAE